MNRQISRLSLVALLLLASLIVATTYWQAWAAPGLAARQDNQIQRVAQFRIKRGLILASNGLVLAANVRRKIGGETLYFRRYPTHGLASQTIGYSTQGRSRAGIERSQNSYLTASNANLGTIFDKLGDTLKGTTITGNNVVLNLRPNAQKIAETALAGQVRRRGRAQPEDRARSTSMASSPGYDPNKIESNSGYASILNSPKACPGSVSPLYNRATQGLYPPGSTFKTVTAAAALDSGQVTTKSPFYDPGYCIEYGQKVSNAGNPEAPEAFGHVDFLQAYEHSINAVFCNVGMKLGARKIIDQAKKFGFYSTPPVELPSGEVAPSGEYDFAKHRLDDDAGRADPGRLAFGQDKLLATPSPDGARRRRGREQRHDHGAASRQGGEEPERRNRAEGEAEGLAEGDEAVDRRRPEHDDAGGRHGRHRHRRTDPGRARGRQDRHRRDQRPPRLRRLVHLLRPGRRPGRRGRRRRRAVARRLRRRGRGADREAADAGDSPADVEVR